MDTTRIRWEPGAEASMTAWFGLVGTCGPHVFQIIKPVMRGDQHALKSELPGLRFSKRDGDPETLKTVAGEWLAAFVSSLGAVFPEPLLELADRWQQFAAKDDAADECARELREAIAGEITGKGESDALA